MKMLLIINPCSGRMKVKNVLVDILQIFCDAGYEVTTHITTARGDATKVVSKITKSKYDLIVCCGGDGTLNEVVTGMVIGNVKLPLGYIPAGSTNDFARTLGLENDLLASARKIVKSTKTIPVDVGTFCDDRQFLYIASFGMFTSTSYTTQQTTKNALGHLAYIFEGISNMGTIETFNVKLKADDKCFEGEYIYGGITNSTSIAGMFKFDSNIVSLNDGLFEVLMIKAPKTPNDYMKIFTGITSGDILNNSAFDFCKASEIELSMPKNVMWSLDGESAKGKILTKISNKKGKINFII